MAVHPTGHTGRGEEEEESSDDSSEEWGYEEPPTSDEESSDDDSEDELSDPELEKRLDEIDKLVTPWKDLWNKTKMVKHDDAFKKIVEFILGDNIGLECFKVHFQEDDQDNFEKYMMRKEQLKITHTKQRDFLISHLENTEAGGGPTEYEARIESEILVEIFGFVKDNPSRSFKIYMYGTDEIIHYLMQVSER